MGQTSRHVWLREPALVKEKATRAGQHDHAPGLLFFYPGKWMDNFSSALARLSTLFGTIKDMHEKLG